MRSTSHKLTHKLTPHRATTTSRFSTSSTALLVLCALCVLLSDYAVCAQVRVTAPWLLSFASSGTSREGHDTGWYHHTQQLLVKLSEMTATCAHASVEWVVILNPKPYVFAPSRTSRQHGKLLLLTLTYNAKARARATSRTARDDRTRIVAVFGEHGRERITSELAFSIVRRYRSQRSTPNELRNLEIILAPIVNVGGRHEAETHDECSRLNTRGVDVNRNYVVQWGHKDENTLLEEETEGVHPLSEWETRAIDAVLRRSKPHAYVSFHSGDRSILLPWDSGHSVPNGMQRVAQRIQTEHCPHCRIGTASQLLGYRAYGTGVDHAVGMYGVPFACTLEIYGFEHRDCKRMFNPLDRMEFASVMRNWSGVMETIGAEVAHLPSNRIRLGAMKSWWWFGGARWFRYRVLFLTETKGNEEMIHYEPPMFFILFVVACLSLVVFMVRGARRGSGKRTSAIIGRRNMGSWRSRVRQDSHLG